jgi:hypothetical protein
LGWDHRLTDLTLNFCTKHLEAEGLLTLVVHHRQLGGGADAGGADLEANA